LLKKPFSDPKMLISNFAVQLKKVSSTGFLACAAKKKKLAKLALFTEFFLFQQLDKIVDLRIEEVFG